MALERELALAKALMESDQLDEAEELIEKIEMVQKAMAAEDAEDDEDDIDDTDGDDNDRDEEDEEDDGDQEDDGVTKSFRENNITYPRDDLTDALNEHRQVEHPQLTTHPTWQKFQERVRAIAHRDGCPMHIAMQRARGEMGADHIAELRQPISAVKKLGLPKTPPLYPESDLQEELASSSRDKKKTHRRRIRRHDQQVKKMTYEDAVATEISKGCSRELAEQKVMYAYGNTLPRSDVVKGAGDTLVTQFMNKVDECIINEQVDRTRAIQIVRKRHPGLYDCFQLL